VVIPYASPGLKSDCLISVFYRQIILPQRIVNGGAAPLSSCELRVQADGVTVPVYRLLKSARSNQIFGIRGVLFRRGSRAAERSQDEQQHRTN